MRLEQPRPEGSLEEGEPGQEEALVGRRRDGAVRGLRQSGASLRLTSSFQLPAGVFNFGQKILSLVLFAKFLSELSLCGVLLRRLSGPIIRYYR